MTGETPRHRMVRQALLAAGGEDVEQLLTPVKGQKRADVLFRELKVIAEVKELASDRHADPEVQQALSYLIAVKGPQMGGPVIFGTM